MFSQISEINHLQKHLHMLIWAWNTTYKITSIQKEDLMMKDDRKGYIIAGVLGFLTYFVGSTIYYFLTH